MTELSYDHPLSDSRHENGFTGPKPTRYAMVAKIASCGGERGDSSAVYGVADRA
nr:hypothetical protein [Micromonospora sp. DSM 115978]